LHQRSKNYDNNCFAVGCKKNGILLSTKMTFTLVQYLRIFYVKERRPCWMAFSHRSLKNDPRMKMKWSLSCVRALLRTYMFYIYVEERALLRTYMFYIYVEERRPCWMAFSHRSLKNDPLMKMKWSLSCVRRSYVRTYEC
jgi:hypothetical protein